MTASGQPAVIGVDLGTGSMKAVLLTLDGTNHGQVRAEYQMSSPRPGWNENEPEDWRRAFVEVVRKLAWLARDTGLPVRAIGLVAQRDPFVLLDARGEPTTPAISWTDSRAREQTVDLRKQFGEDRLITLTGTKPIVGLGLANLLWTAEHLPDAWGRTQRITSPKDYVLSEILGSGVTDSTTPTRSLAFDIEENGWSEEILTSRGIDADLFDRPEFRSWDPRGTLGERWAEKLGLTPDVVLAAGGADDQAAALGGGAVAPGQISLGTGTCSDWRLVLPEYQPDRTGTGDTAPHVVPDVYIREVTIDSAGSSLRWFRRALCPDLSFTEIIALAQTAPRGSAGVRFYPFVDGGQRAPHYMEESAGVFFGITSHHGREHLARSVLEGIALLYPKTFELLVRGREATVEAGPLTLVDAEAASDPWTQMKANILGRPLRRTAVTEAAAVGGAVLGATAAGLFDDPTQAAGAMVRHLSAVDPEEVAVDEYRSIREDYDLIFQTVAPSFRRRAGAS
ncbi:MAG: xylulokinase [Propionibacteriaceae bacterium]